MELESLVDLEWENGLRLPKVETDDDPLGGAVSPPEEVAVPDDVAVPAPEDTPGTGSGRVKIVNLNALLETPSGGDDTEIPHKLLNAPTAPGQPQICGEASNQPTEMSSSQSRITKLLEAIDVDCEEDCEQVDEVQMGNGLKEPSIEDELSELLLIKRPAGTASTKSGSSDASQAQPPISALDDHSEPVPFNLPTNSHVPIQPKPIGRTSKNGQLLSATTPVFPGSNVIVVRTPDGRYITRPLPSPGCGSGGRPVGRPKLTANVQSQPDPKVYKQPKFVSVGNSNATNHVNNGPANISNSETLTKIKLGSVPPVSPSASKPKPLWPPPVYSRKRKKPKPSLPLSGSWTNPNPPPVVSQGVDISQPETDPLEGPVQDIVPFRQPANDSFNIGTFVPVESLDPDPAMVPSRSTRGTQCCMFPPDCASLKESLGLSGNELQVLKRPSVLTRGVEISAQTKLILYNVLKYFEQRKSLYNLHYVATEMTANATGVKINTLRKIMREAKDSCDTNDPKSMPTFKAPAASGRKRRYRTKTVYSNMHIDSALRRSIHEHFLKKKTAPSLKYLQARCHLKNLNFVVSRTRKIGCVTLRTARRKITIEGTPIRSWRYNYLKQIETALEEKKNIVCTFVVELRELKMSQTDWVVMEYGEKLNEKCRVLTLFCAADENGFIDGSFFVHDAIVNHLRTKKQEWYVEWLETHVLKKIPEGSVVVLAHDKYHNMDDGELRPSAGSSKKEVVDWLRSRVIGEIDENLPKCVLLEEVSRIPVKMKYKVDSLVETYGHTAVHLPPSQRDLNPLEYLWEDFRDRNSNRRGRLSIAAKSLADEFKAIEHKLTGAWMLAQEFADGYRKNDPLLDDAQDAAIKKLGGVWNSPSNGPLPEETGDDLDVNLDSSDSTSSDSDSESSSESDSDSDSDSSDSDAESSTSSSDSEGSAADVSSERVNGHKKRKID